MTKEAVKAAKTAKKVEPENVPAKSVQELSIERARANLNHAVDALTGAVLNLQTASPKYKATCDSLKEHIGDFVIVNKLLGANLAEIGKRNG